MPNLSDTVARLRVMCLPLPEAIEQSEGSVGDTVFKVRGKIFAMVHSVRNRDSLWCKAAPGLQDILIASEPARYFVPPYVGHYGWVGVWLDVDLDWDFMAHLIEESYRRTAPKRLSVLLGDQKRLK